MRLQYTLELQEPVDVTLADLLSLRRELLASARSLEDQSGTDYTDLLTSQVATDPEIVKRFQKPSPAIVLEIDPDMAGAYHAGDQLKIGVLLPGKAIAQAPALFNILIRQGDIGLCKGQGRFELVAIDSLRPEGHTVTVWAEGQPSGDLEYLIDPFSWWFEQRSFDRLHLEFVTPARLLTAGKPLFRPTFETLFPFILRRVGSQLSHCCFVEIPNAHHFLAAAGRVEVEASSLEWRDWKCFTAREENRDLGGLVGTLTCRGAALEELHWLLRLGELFNVGKSAAWGAGRFRLKFSD